MPAQPFGIEFPLGGLDKNFAIQKQKPFTTPSALNVRPQEAQEGRMRGGTRPGLRAVIFNRIGSGNPVRFIHELRETLINELEFRDDFTTRVIQDHWTAASWLDAGLLALSSLSDSGTNFSGAWNGIGSNNPYGTVLTTVLNIDETVEYRMAMGLSSGRGIKEDGTESTTTSEAPGEAYMFLRMHNSSPTLSLVGGAGDGIQVRWHYTDAGGTQRWNAEIKVIESGVVSVTTTLQTLDLDRTDLGGSPHIEITITGSTLEAFHEGTSMGTMSLAAYTFVGKNMGIGHDSGASAGTTFGQGFIRSLTVTYTPDILVQNNRVRIIAASNGKLHKKRSANLMDAIASTTTVESAGPVNVVEFGSKLYIADYSEAASAIDGTLTGTPDFKTLRSTTLSAEIADFTSQSVFSVNDHAVVIDSGVATTGAVVAGAYLISSLGATTITLVGLPNATETGLGSTSIKFRIIRRPKRYDISTNTLDAWDDAEPTLVTSGLSALPYECKLITRYRGRIVLAGDQANPNLFYMSRSNDTSDWDAGQTDSLRAVGGSSTEANVIGDAITSLMPHADDYLLVGCENSLWIVRGDLTFGGQIDRLSDNVGVVSAKAWTKGPNSEVYFLSRQGLYVVQPGDSPYPVPISERKIAGLLSRLPLDTEAYLGYDSAARGISIFVTTPNGDDENYFYHLETQSFWPEQYPATMTPTAMLWNSENTAQDGGLIVGSQDGWLRQFQANHSQDHRTDFSAHVYLGPLFVGGTTREGILSELQSFMAKYDSLQVYHDVTWSLYSGDSAELALVNTTAAATGTWSGGKNIKARPRVRGNVIYLKLSSASGKWQVERIYGKRIKGGEHR